MEPANKLPESTSKHIDNLRGLLVIVMLVGFGIALLNTCSCVGDDGQPTRDGITKLQRAIDKSGTRIERWSHITAGILTDGTEIDTPPTYTLYDTKYKWECTMQMASDGQRRCLPGHFLAGGNLGAQYLDAACTSMITIGPFIDVTGTHGWDEKLDVYPLGAEIMPAPSFYYAPSAGVCTKIMFGSYPPHWKVRARFVGPKIPTSDFIGYASSGPVDTRL